MQHGKISTHHSQFEKICLSMFSVFIARCRAWPYGLEVDSLAAEALPFLLPTDA